jgi:hypothetical protein
MIEDYIIRTGDLEPPMEVTLSAATSVDASGQPIRMLLSRGGVIAIDRAPSDLEVELDADGKLVTKVTLEWQAGDTDEPGPYEVEVEVNWNGNRPQTFDSCNRCLVRRDADL